MGWFREKPSKADSRWSTRGVIAIVLGIIAFVGGAEPAEPGLTLIAGALVIGGVAMLVMSNWMDSVTMPGAMIRAMLAAYRRTLEKTMAQSRSMDQVVAKAGLAWLETPDQAVVWGTALGLEKRDRGRPRAQPRRRQGRADRGRAPSTCPPGTEAVRAGGASGGGGGGGGLFSSSAVPNLGGMMAALGTIGNSPSSSSSSGGGGFSGGSSGGGGGGSGGGF